ncbi:MAG: PHP-associated domain-containing protein [Haloferacaceae archaeon]
MHVKVLDDRVVRRAKRAGIGVLVYAPHFTRLPTIRQRAERFSDDELLVVPARELFTGNWRNRRHVLALGLSRPIPDFLTIEGTFAELRRQDAVVVVPHPEFATVSLNATEITARNDVLAAVETYNAKLFPRQNRRAQEVARETGLPSFGSSYAHLRGTVGEAWTCFERELRTEADLLAALRERAPRRVMKRSGVDHRLRGLVEFAHLGYENSWKKLDRVFLSGTEPTHPSHVAYGGRFDEVSVY